MLKPPENEPSNARSFSFQSKASHSQGKDEEANAELMEQFEEAIAERDQRIEGLELQLQQKEKDFLDQIRSYETRLLGFQSSLPPSIAAEKPEILKEIEVHNKKLEELLLSCEKQDLKGLISLEKTMNQEDFYGIEALKRAFEDKLARMREEQSRNIAEMKGKIGKSSALREDLEKEMGKLRERERALKAENTELKQKVLELNTKIFEMSQSLRSLRSDSSSREKSQESLLVKEYVQKIEAYAKNEMKYELELAKLREIASISQEIELKLKEKDELIAVLEEKTAQNAENQAQNELKLKEKDELIAFLEEKAAQNAENQEQNEEFTQLQDKFRAKTRDFEAKAQENRLLEAKIRDFDGKLREKDELIAVFEGKVQELEEKAAKNVEKPTKTEETRLLEHKLRDKTQTYDAKKQENRVLENKLLAKITELAEKESENKGLKAKIEFLEIKAQEDQEKIRDLSMDNHDLTEKNSLLIQELSEYQQKAGLQQLPLTNDLSFQQTPSEADKTQTLEAENARLLAELASKHQKISLLESKIAENHEKMSVLESEIAETQLKMSMTETNISENYPSGAERSEKSKKKAALKGKKDEFPDKKQPSEAELREIEGKAALYEETIEKVGTLQEELKDLRERVEALEEENAALGEDNARLCQEKLEHIEKIAKSEEETANLMTKLELNAKELENCKKAGMKAMKSSPEIGNAKAKCVALELRSSEWLSEKNMLLNKIKELEEASERALKQAISTQKTQQVSSERAESQKITELETVISQLSIQKSKLEVEISSTIETNQELSRNFEKNSEKLYVFEEKLRTLTEENAKITKAIDVKEATLQSVLKENKKLKPLEEKLSEVTNQLASKSDLLAKKDSTISHLEETNHVLTQKTTDLAHKTALLESKTFELTEKLSKNANFQAKIAFLHSKIAEIRRFFSDFRHLFIENLEKTIDSLNISLKTSVFSFFNELQLQTEDKMLIIQRLYDKKEATYRGNYESQISRLEKDLESITNSFKDSDGTAYLNERPQKLVSGGPSSLLQHPGSASKSEFINYLAKKSGLTMKNSQNQLEIGQNSLKLSQNPQEISQNPLENSQKGRNQLKITQNQHNYPSNKPTIPLNQPNIGQNSIHLSPNPLQLGAKAFSFTPRLQQSQSFYVQTQGYASPYDSTSAGKRILSEVGSPMRLSWEGTQKEVNELKKSLSLLHDEHQKLLEVVEMRGKGDGDGVFAVKCFEKLFDQLAVSLERESQLRMMAQTIEEKLTKASSEGQAASDLLRQLDEKASLIKALDQELTQYKAICKELQIQLDFKRAQMKFLTQNNSTSSQNNEINNINSMNNPNNAIKNMQRLIEVKRDRSLTHQHRSPEENEFVPNVSISYQRGHMVGLKSPKTPQKAWGNKDLKAGNRGDNSVKRTEKGKRWV